MADVPALSSRLGARAVKAEQPPVRAQGAILTIFLIALYFMSYRYPFQIGDTDTSPTYSDTPVWLQVTKYVLLAPFLAYSFAVTRMGRWSFGAAELTIFALASYGAFYGTAMAVTGAAFGFTLVQICFALFFALLFANPNVMRGSFATFSNCLLWFFIISLFDYAIQIILYLEFDRLPALGYYDSFPRFGGVWDDPNSAAAIFVFIMPWAFVRWGLRWVTAAVALVSTIAILLSQSLTTYATIVVVLGIVLLAFYRSVPIYTRIFIMLLLMVFAIVLVVILGFVILQSVDLTIDGILRSADTLLTSKFGSIAVRQNSYSFTSEISLMTLLGFDPIEKFGENQWLNLAANVGLPFTIVYAVMQILTVRNLWTWANSLGDGPTRAVVAGMFGYYLWFFLLQVNIPASQIFPINILAGVVSGMSWAWRVHWQARLKGQLLRGQAH